MGGSTGTCVRVNNSLEALTLLIHKLLQNTEMTSDELVACLSSEPYDIGQEDLELVPLALKKIHEKMLLIVKFRLDRKKEVEVVLKTLAADL